MKKYSSLIVTLAAIVLVVGGLVYLNRKQTVAPGQYDKLAQCLTQKGVKFYGASWCPHCAEQKKLFGTSVKRLPYVECSPGGPNAPSAPICQEKNINSYPTWIINGQRYTGVQPLDALAQMSNFKYEGDQKK